ncbi:MAG TPA: thioredoxin domain-containing protein [Oscillatoriaceae cyanobacterium M33_DOE_052]|uniref:Glutathione reductase n=1 Tax=Oscillatoriales cyanobacterium SpSt-418 TaxID=2282169 RepID=A0A7C3KE58_9CYAN|nr:thioredoxin domain-containing protein [Oscillatoriaceae cyanobacterium M33_DOE_052]
MTIPIPTRPSGYQRGPCDALVQVEAFLDIECPFSKKAWSTLVAIADEYVDREVRFTLHPVVLANHRQSWDVTKVAVILAADDPVRFWDVFNYLYERQDQYTEAALLQQTHVDLYNLLAQFAAEYSDWQDETEFIRQLTSDRVEQETKVPIRYAISRSVWSTPTFFINGSEASQLSSSSSLADWKSILDPLLP